MKGRLKIGSDGLSYRCCIDFYKVSNTSGNSAKLLSMATWGMEESCWAVCAPVVTAMARILALAAISRSWVVSPTTDGLFRFNTQSVAEGEYHIGRGFGRIFAGAGGFQPKGLGVGLCDGFVQAASAFAGGDGKPIALLFQALQAGQGFGEQSHVVVVGIEIVRGIGLNQGFLNVFADVVGKAANDAGEAVSDERADLVGFGNGQAAIGKALLKGVDDGVGGVGKCAVPSRK